MHPHENDGEGADLRESTTPLVNSGIFVHILLNSACIAGTLVRGEPEDPRVGPQTKGRHERQLLHPGEGQRVRCSKGHFPAHGDVLLRCLGQMGQVSQEYTQIRCVFLHIAMRIHVCADENCECVRFLSVFMVNSMGTPRFDEFSVIHDIFSSYCVCIAVVFQTSTRCWTSA